MILDLRLEHPKRDKKEGPAAIEYGMMPREYRSVEWRSRGIPDVNQSRSRSYGPRKGGVTKICQKGHPVNVPKQMEEEEPRTPPIRARRTACRRQPCVL